MHVYCDSQNNEALPNSLYADQQPVSAYLQAGRLLQDTIWGVAEKDRILMTLNSSQTQLIP